MLYQQKRFKVDVFKFSWVYFIKYLNKFNTSLIGYLLSITRLLSTLSRSSIWLTSLFSINMKHLTLCDFPITETTNTSITM